MTDTAQCVTAAISFFGLLQQTQIFIKESHKRLNIYLEQHPNVRLSQIGATRWRSKSDATYQIFSYYNTWAECEDVQANQGKNNRPVLTEIHEIRAMRIHYLQNIKKFYL